MTTKPNYDDTPIFYDVGKILVGYKYADTDFVKADKYCSNCDNHTRNNLVRG